MVWEKANRLFTVVSLTKENLTKDEKRKLDSFHLPEKSYDEKYPAARDLEFHHETVDSIGPGNFAPSLSQIRT
jgi:hypothetical protein